MSKVKSYLSLIKFSHTIFAMPFALIGFFFGLSVLNHSGFNDGQWNLNKTMTIMWDQENRVLPFSIDSLAGQIALGEGNAWDIARYFLLVILCMVFARSAAMAFNRYLDRNFDAQNPRTAIREIPAGILKANNVLLFTIVNCILFIATTYFINKLCFILSPVALLVVLGYSYTKRFTPLCHLVLGIGLSLAPIGAYLAVTGNFALIPLLFSFAVIFWVSGFDIIYALQDEDFDKSQSLYSIPSWLGKEKALKVSEWLHMLSIASVSIAGAIGKFGWFYWAGVAVFSGMIYYQHSIVKPYDLRRVNVAFMTANGIASVVFAALVILDLFFTFR